MKKLLLFPCLALAFCLGSCDSSDDEVMTIELVCPKNLEVKTELATASFKWDAVAKAESYAYALDNSTEYTPIDASSTTLMLTKLSRGTHTFRIHSVGNGAHTTDSAERTIDFEIDPMLATPAPSFKMGSDMTSAIFSWEVVKGAQGYEYKFSGDSDWTRVGAAVLTVTKSGLLANHDYTFTIRAIGQLPDSENSADFEYPFRMIDTSKGGWIILGDGTPLELGEPTGNIYSSTIDCKASDSFAIRIDGVEYGFTSYSGNGGVGTVENTNATLGGTKFYVRESVGRMTAKSGDATVNKFWVNVSAACKVFVKADLSNADGIARYYLQLVEEKDEKILLEQYFDLMTLGGNWLDGTNSRKSALNVATSMDGTEPAEAGGITPATLGVTIASSATANKQYIVNRGLSGWTIENCYEFAGLLRLSSPGYGVLTTPKLTGLTAPATVTFTFDGLAFGKTTDYISVKVLNGGTISSAEVKIKGATTATSIAPESGNTSFIITNAHCPGFDNSAAKAYSNFTIVIENATADTQISWDTTAITTLNNARLCLDNIIIRKN